jgi:hypothetical protein
MVADDPGLFVTGSMAAHSCSNGPAPARGKPRWRRHGWTGTSVARLVEFTIIRCDADKDRGEPIVRGCGRDQVHRVGPRGKGDSSEQNRRMEGQGGSESSAGSCRFGRCYAKAMSTIASSAVDKAAKAALEALLAHYDVEVSKLKR